MTPSPGNIGRPTTIPGPDPHTRPPRVQFPAGACDCHAHVFGPQGRFPYLAQAAYIPPDASPQDYARNAGARLAANGRSWCNRASTAPTTAVWSRR